MHRTLLFVVTGGRRYESEAGLIRVGIDEGHQLHYLDEPDGELHINTDSFSIIADTVDETIETYDITRVVTLGSIGYTGHADHIATHDAGVVAVKNQRAAGRVIEHAALNADGAGEFIVPATMLGIRRKFAAMAEHGSQYPVRLATGQIATYEAVVQGYAVDRSFWGTFVCRSLVGQRETYDLM